MPQYYSNADQGSAFSNGLRDGYEFVDRIFARKRQQKLDQQNADRADRQLKNQEADTLHDNGIADKVEGRAATAADQQNKEHEIRMRYLEPGLQQQVRAGKVALEVAEAEQARLLTKYKQEDQTFATDQKVKGLQISAAQQAIADAAAARKARGEYADFQVGMLAPQPQAPVATPPSAPAPAPALAPSPLATVGQQATAVPYDRTLRGGRGSTSGNQVTFPTKKPEAAAPPTPPPAGGRGRPATQITMPPKKAVSTAGITKPVHASDPRVTTAMRTAADSTVGTQSLSQTELRSMNTQLARMDSTKKLTPKQAETLSNAYRYGVIDDATYQNWIQHNQPIAPAQPKFLGQVGENGSLVQIGGQIVTIGGTGKGDTAAVKSANAFIDSSNELMKSYIANGNIDLDEKAARAELSNQLAIMYSQDPASVQALMSSPMGARALVDATATRLSGTNDPRESPLAIENAPPVQQNGWGAPAAYHTDGSPIYDLTGP